MNPILPLAYATPDVEAHVWPQDPNRVYLYCSNDRIDGGGMSPCQHCFSSEDLVHWTDHGVTFDASTAIPWVSMTDLPAIDVAEKNGRWYYYFTVHSLLRERKFALSARRPALSPLRSLKSVWMPPMVPASACVKSTIPAGRLEGISVRNFNGFPRFFLGMWDGAAVYRSDVVEPEVSECSDVSRYEKLLLHL